MPTERVTRVGDGEVRLESCDLEDLDCPTPEGQDSDVGGVGPRLGVTAFPVSGCDRPDGEVPGVGTDPLRR